MSKGRICSEVMEKMRRQVPLLVRKAESMDVPLSDLPIILYCAHSECNAAKRLASHLMKSGFTNLYYYREGVRGWLREN
jgi:rhodanese-related sulfurtransferase